MQNLPIQLGINGDEVVQQPEDKFHRLIQAAHLGFLLPLYYKHQSPSTLQFAIVLIHVRRRNPESIFG